MLKSILSKFKFGSAELDLVLDRDEFRIGETATGKIRVKTGGREETLKNLKIELWVHSSYKQDDLPMTVAEVIATEQWKDSLTVEANQELEFAFSMKIPEYIPASGVHTYYLLKTNLDVEEGKDPTDVDRIRILPTGLVHNFLSGMERLGCKVHAEGYFGNGRNQAFWYTCTTWLAGKLDELEFEWNPSNTAHQLVAKYEIEKKTFSEQIDKLDLNERKGTHVFSSAELATPESAAEAIRMFVEKYYHNLIS